jgi:hypothetical protein
MLFIAAFFLVLFLQWFIRDLSFFQLSLFKTTHNETAFHTTASHRHPCRSDIMGERRLLAQGDKVQPGYDNPLSASA